MAIEFPADQLHYFREQTCSEGCVAGFLVGAVIFTFICSGLMCFFFWPGMELVSRQERRVGARKRIRERDELRAQAQAEGDLFQSAD